MHQWLSRLAFTRVSFTSLKIPLDHCPPRRELCFRPPIFQPNARMELCQASASNDDYGSIQDGKGHLAVRQMATEATVQVDALNGSPDEETSRRYADRYGLISDIDGTEQEFLHFKSPLNWLPSYSSANLGLRSLFRLCTRQRNSKLHQQNTKRLATCSDRPPIRMRVPKSILISVNDIVLKQGRLTDHASKVHRVWCHSFTSHRLEHESVEVLFGFVVRSQELSSARKTVSFQARRAPELKQQRMAYHYETSSPEPRE